MKTALLAATVVLLSACANNSAPAPADPPATSTPAQASPDRPMPEPTPEERARPLQEPTELPPATGWDAAVLPAHRAMVDDALARARSAASGADEASREARALLARAQDPLPPGDIDGNWRVRSIQIGDGRGYGYPFFDARISSAGTGHRFAKTSGSQRRSGRLYPMDGPGLAFLGARTVNEEAPRTYTRIARPDASLPGEHDSAGLLLRIGPRELLMVLDADGNGFELYHLER
ncbi:DUF4893 domain-containing protein [Luteimonas sp. A537]